MQGVYCDARRYRAVGNGQGWAQCRLLLVEIPPREINGATRDKTLFVQTRIRPPVTTNIGKRIKPERKEAGLSIAFPRSLLFCESFSFVLLPLPLPSL